MSAETVLEARMISKEYRVGPVNPFRTRRLLRAVTDVELTLAARETVGIVGESGCGKSTLAAMLAGMIKPTRGEVELLGRPLSRLGRRELRRARRDVQLVHQDPYTSLDPRMSAGAIIAEPLHVHPDAVPRSGRRAAVLELLELVGLNPDHADRLPHQFSGGQRQRIGIARALALRPKVVVCDEPVSALDVSVQAQIVNLLMRLQAELGLAYVFISHDLSVVSHIADRIAVMYLGRVVEQGPAPAVEDFPAHPYTEALLAAVPEPDRTRRRATRIGLRGEPPSPLAPPSGCAFRTRCPYAEDRCAAERPELHPLDQDHLAACHLPLGS
ncbi:ABC transporter ATP-binding protein [Microlunatus sp. GCM10028923]|uniref:ABC transporter ATP-binding protein n=1 Tax=Microlunatus sp. GCM10028923 TaxID=3273400 RepID=UPI003607A719